MSLHYALQQRRNRDARSQYNSSGSSDELDGSSDGGYTVRAASANAFNPMSRSMQVPVHPALSRLHSLGKSGSPSPHRSRSRSRASSGSGGGARLATPLSTYKIRKASLWDHNETTLFRVKYDGNQSLNAVISWRPPNTVGPRAMPFVQRGLGLLATWDLHPARRASGHLDDVPTPAQLSKMGHQGHLFYDFFSVLFQLSSDPLHRTEELKSRWDDTDFSIVRKYLAGRAAQPSDKAKHSPQKTPYTRDKTVSIHPRTTHALAGNRNPDVHDPTSLWEQPRGRRTSAELAEDAANMHLSSEENSPSNRNQGAPRRASRPRTPLFETETGGGDMSGDETYVWILAAGFLRAVSQLATVANWSTLRRDGDDKDRQFAVVPHPKQLRLVTKLGARQLVAITDGGLCLSELTRSKVNLEQPCVIVECKKDSGLRGQQLLDFRTHVRAQVFSQMLGAATAHMNHGKHFHPDGDDTDYTENMYAIVIIGTHFSIIHAAFSHTYLEEVSNAAILTEEIHMRETHVMDLRSTHGRQDAFLAVIELLAYMRCVPANSLLRSWFDEYDRFLGFAANFAPALETATKR